MARRSARIKKDAVPVQGNWDVLPHGMGVLPTPTSQSAEQIIPNARALKPKNPNNHMTSQPKLEKPEKQTQNDVKTIAVISTTKSQVDEKYISKVEGISQESSVTITPQQPNEEAHQIKEETERLEQVPTLRRSKRVHAQAQVKIDEDDAGHESPPKKAKQIAKQVGVEDDVINIEGQPTKIKRVPRKTKDNPYGLTPGRSPFPEWHAPSAAQCAEVYRLLADVHGEVTQPKTIPAPSLEIAGCGEVPFVLEALLRTLLSGAVTFDGADNMIKGIIAKYGIIEDELAKGSIDWNKVRLSTIEELEDAIRIGGLANRKAKAIKGTLDMVYQDNIDRREAYLAEKETGVPANVYGASEKTQGQKDLEIVKTERNILSLDHLHGLSADEAMQQFTKFPGIGVKTAACVILFCLQRPCFAVDTHVHRFSRWLGWAPTKADENDTFSHLEVRCPDHLKYGLHQLFIHHGKHCGRCKMSTVEGTKEWQTVVCPLEHLLVRAKKMTRVQKKPKSKNKKADLQEGDELESELSEVDEALFEGEEF
ncbi:DNA glycosylase [Hypoxylon argillaceum]|nr:DNA glycosylase [Hypoxylon argillaceum]